MQHHQPTTLPPVAPAGAAYSLPPFSFGWPSPGPVRLQTRGTRHVAYGSTVDPDSAPGQPQAHLTSICALPAFQQPAGIVKSHEELRWEDWQTGLKSQESAFPPPPACVAGLPGGVAGGGGGAQQQLRRSVSAGPPGSSGGGGPAAAAATTTVAVPFTAFADPFGVNSAAGGSSGGVGGGSSSSGPLSSMPLTPPQFGFGFFGSGAGAGSSSAVGGSAQAPPGAANPFFAVPMAGVGGAAVGGPGATGGAPMAGPFGAPFGAAPAVQPTFGATPCPPLLAFASSTPTTVTTGSPLLPPVPTDASAPGPAAPGGWTATPQVPAAVLPSGGTRHVEYERTRDLSFESLREAQYLMSISALPHFQPDANIRSHEELRWEDRQSGIRSALDAPSPRLATPTAAAAGSVGPGAFDSAAGAVAAAAAVATPPPPVIARARPATANAASPSIRTSCFAPGRSSSSGSTAALTGPGGGGGSRGGMLMRPPSAAGPPPRRHVTFLLGGFVSSPLGTPVEARPASAATASAGTVAAPGTDAGGDLTVAANPFGVPAPASPPSGHIVTSGTRPSRRGSGSGAPPQPAAQPGPVTRAPSFGRDWLPHSAPAPASTVAGGGAAAANGAAGARSVMAVGTLATPYARTLDLDSGVGPSGPSYLVAISAMSPFQPPPLGIVKSHEELRWEDRKAGVRNLLSGPPPPPPPPAAAAVGSGTGPDGGLEGQCCVCMERRAEYGFVHSCVVHLCLCSQCQDEMGRRDRLSNCLVCNEKAMSVVKVVAT